MDKKHLEVLSDIAQGFEHGVGDINEAVLALGEYSRIEPDSLTFENKVPVDTVLRLENQNDPEYCAKLKAEIFTLVGLPADPIHESSCVYQNLELTKDQLRDLHEQIGAYLREDTEEKPKTVPVDTDNLWWKRSIKAPTAQQLKSNKKPKIIQPPEYVPLDPFDSIRQWGPLKQSGGLVMSFQSEDRPMIVRTCTDAPKGYEAVLTSRKPGERKSAKNPEFFLTEAHLKELRHSIDTYFVDKEAKRLQEIEKLRQQAKDLGFDLVERED